MSVDQSTAGNSRCLLSTTPWLKILTFSIFLVVVALIHDPHVVHCTKLASDHRSGQGKKVLVLSSYGYSLPSYQKLNRALLLEMKNNGVGTSDLFFEYLDLFHIQEVQQKRALAEMLRSKYAKLGIDLVITLHYPAMSFFQNKLAEVFPGIPVLFWNLHEAFHEEDPTRRIFQTTVSPDVQGTLERALELFPDTARVVIITGGSEIDRQAEMEARRVLAGREGKLQFEYTADSSVEEILARVADLPPQSIILYYHIFQDKTGRSFTPSDVAGRVVTSANAPVFCLYDTHMERGVIGGSLVSFEAEGGRIGKIALDILGDKIGATNEITIMIGRPATVFDWQQIKKWGGKADNLPEGTVFLYPPFSLWSYKWHIFGVLAVMVAQLLLIGLLVAERRHRRRVEEELRISNKTLEQRVADRVVQLQQEEARYSALFNSMIEGVALHEIICDKEGKPVDYLFLEVNPAFERLTGLSREALIGKTVRQVLPGVEAHWIESYGRVALEGTPAHFESYSTPLSRWYEVAAYQNNPGRFVVFISDITERKRAEEALWKSEEQLLHAEKLAAIGRLSASLAHEFNNPLQSITTILKGIGQYADLRENEAKLVDLAFQECRRMGNLIANLQDFYRPSTGRIESVDLHAVLDALLLMAKKDFNNRKISVVKEYAADLPVIDAVSDQMKQVFLNLLNNAADAYEDGGVITITTEALGREKVAVHLKDSGVGIDSANIDHIFEPFFTTKRPHKGTGLGLSVSYGIIKKHGGQIEVKSEPGKGTVFSVFLPVQGAGNKG